MYIYKYILLYIIIELHNYIKLNDLLVYNPNKNNILYLQSYKHIVVSIRVRDCGHVSIHVTLSIYINMDKVTCPQPRTRTWRIIYSKMKEFLMKV